jgi:hypothetical protein
MDGQLLFSSGWEWGYWLNDVVAARAAWGFDETGDEGAALEKLLTGVLRAFGDAAPALADAVLETARHQKTLLVQGDYGQGAPADIARRSGMAYLQGVDAWDDAADLAKGVPGLPQAATQPDKLGLVELQNPLHDPPSYADEIAPLLAAMEETFGADVAQLERAGATVPSMAAPLFDELVRAARMTALRAQQVHGLYDYASMAWTSDRALRNERLETARRALDQARLTALEQEGAYRVPLSRVAAWAPGPTSYPFGYLWTVHSLHYWWRDEGKAVDAPASPCYLNVLDAISIGLGEGQASDTGDAIYDLTGGLGLAKCLSVPDAEPSYPPEGLRMRP